MLAPVVDKIHGSSYVLGLEDKTKERWPDALRWIPKTVNNRKVWVRAYLTTKFLSAFYYRGIFIWPAVKLDFDYLIGKTAQKVIANLAHFRGVLEMVKPDVLVTAFDQSPAMRGHVLMSKELGIPTVEVQHGLLTPLSMYAEPISDLYAVGGETSKSVYMGAGVPEDRIVITGFPKYDVYQSAQRNGNGYILFATNPLDVNKNLEIIEVLAKLGEKVVVKPHPSEGRASYLPIAKKLNISVRNSGEDISQMIADCDLLVMEDSTVGIEAAMMNKPIVNIGIGHTNVSPYVTAGVALNAASLDDLKAAVQVGLQNGDIMAKNRAAFVREYAYLQDGMAAERVVDLIQGFTR